MRRICDKQLRRWYLRYRAKYFAGALPKDVDVYWSAAEDCYGLVREDGKGFVLQMNPKYALDGRVARMTLLHEMVHLGLHPVRNHGAMFETEMLRLARMGAFKSLW